MARRAYPTDLSDAEYAYIEPYLPLPCARRRPRRHTWRELLDGSFYLTRSGGAWRLLPHEFPPWQTVYHCFRQWRLDGTWERLHSGLRAAVRTRAAPASPGGAFPGGFCMAAAGGSGRPGTVALDDRDDLVEVERLGQGSRHASRLGCGEVRRTGGHSDDGDTIPELVQVR